VAATPANAQRNGEVTLTTPDGAEHTCEQDFPGASFEALLVADGYTERYELTGVVDGQPLDLVVLCRPEQG
jgi:hypothetical protein